MTVLRTLLGGVHAQLAAEKGLRRGVVQGVQRPFQNDEIAPWVHVVADAPEHLGDVLDVHVLVHHHDDLREHHLPQAPKGVHHLADLAGVAFVDGNETKVVENSFQREIHVHHFRELFLDDWQEDALRGLAHVAVLHGRRPHQRGGIDGVFPVRDGGDVEDGVVVRQGVIPGVVAEGAFAATFVGLHISLEHELTFSGDLQIHGLALHQLHGRLAQEPREKELVHLVGNRRRGGVCGDGIRPQSHRHFQAFPALFRQVMVVGPALVAVPVHAGGGLVEHLHAIHAHIAHACLGILRDDKGHGDEGPGVLRPRGEDGEHGEIDVLAGQHDVLATTAGDVLGKDVGHARELGQHLKFLDDAVRFLDLDEFENLLGHVVQAVHLQGLVHALVGPVEVRENWKFAVLDVGEQKRRPIAFRGAVGDFRDLQVGVEGLVDASEFVFRFKPLQKGLQVLVRHGAILQHAKVHQRQAWHKYLRRKSDASAEKRQACMPEGRGQERGLADHGAKAAGSNPASPTKQLPRGCDNSSQPHFLWRQQRGNRLAR